MRPGSVRRRAVVLALLVIAAVAIAVALPLRSQRAADVSARQRTVALFPAPGTRTAAPGTQITLRGLAPARMRGLVVRGSRTGPHAGRIVVHTDRAGASFVPDRPFAPGERVTVRAPLPVAEAGGRAATFAIARTPAAGPARASAATPSKASGAQRFRSRPDLRPPAIDVRTNTVPAAPGLFFVAPKGGSTQAGPMILDGAGRLLWSHRMPHGLQAYDFRAQTYRSRPVLTWWQGRFLGAFGAGEGVVYDRALRRIARVRAGNGYQADLHEFLLTPQNTALVTIYNRVRADLSPIGGSRRGTVLEGVVQEIDVATGAVLFEWHSLRDIGLGESFMAPDRKGAEPFDYIHINSVEVDTDGNLLVSGRHTQAVYKIDRRTGAILWRLGGRRTDFRMGPGTDFKWQHDARRRSDGAITLFDNRARQPAQGIRSRAVALRVDESARTADVVGELRHPGRVLAASQGNAQSIPGGTVVGWGGRNPLFSQFDARGAVVFDARFGDRKAESYRAYRMPWTGTPASKPALAARATARGMVVYASWNGATEVAAWRVVAPSGTATRALGRTRRTGFETAIHVRSRATRVAVQALGADGRVLATSQASRVR